LCCLTFLPVAIPLLETCLQDFYRNLLKFHHCRLFLPLPLIGTCGSSRGFHSLEQGVGSCINNSDDLSNMYWCPHYELLLTFPFVSHTHLPWNAEIICTLQSGTCPYPFRLPWSYCKFVRMSCLVVGKSKCLHTVQIVFVCPVLKITKFTEPNRLWSL
jgi:hypothetical protein